MHRTYHKVQRMKILSTQEHPKQTKFIWKQSKYIDLKQTPNVVCSLFLLAKYFRLGQSINYSNCSTVTQVMVTFAFATFVTIIFDLSKYCRFGCDKNYSDTAYRFITSDWICDFWLSFNFVLSKYCHLGGNIKLQWHWQVHLGLSPQTAFVTFVTACFGKDTCRRAPHVSLC